MMKKNLKKMNPEPYSDEEKEYIDFLVKKYGFRIGTKEEKYRVYK
jgi:hypothetical protein